MEIDGWIGGFKVRSFPWIEGKLKGGYFNAVQLCLQNRR